MRKGYSGGQEETHALLSEEGTAQESQERLAGTWEGEAEAEQGHEALCRGFSACDLHSWGLRSEKA